MSCRPCLLLVLPVAAACASSPPVGTQAAGLATGPGVCPDNPARPPDDRPGDFRAQDFPGPVFLVEGGVVVAEAEDLARTRNWRRVSENPETVDGSRFTGAAYVEWAGYLTTGGGREEDMQQVFQGSRCDWLVLKFDVRPGEEGEYVWKSRNINFKKDGDNDYWSGYIGQPAGREPIERRGNRNRPAVGQGKFHYEDETLPPIGDGSAIVQRRYFGPGMHAVYFQGRSLRWGFDRLVLYRVGDARAEARAKDPATPPSRVVSGTP